MGGFQQRPWTPTKRRGPIAAEYTSPGPACVTLPNLLGTSSTDSKNGRAPAFSFGARHGGKNDTVGPGPGQYNITGLSSKGKDCPPALSLHSRNKDEKHDNTPAPGYYDLEKSDKATHDSSPKFTFGYRTHLEKPSSTPAPNVYKIPGVLGATKEGNKCSAPSFSLSGRSKEPVDDRVNTPGPGTYNSMSDVTLPKSPAYSVAPRIQPPSANNIKPGPGTYSPEKIRIDIPPAHTFGIKHSEYLGNLRSMM
ncbi:outer dense fiber protein 3-like isoform X1 [Cimex lectularius]|uniref:Outer dense fiber protein 3 n=1 Tax=Cimex lectularius TaxID=79782 RepID=A0A8I6S1N9_CIMLE|nr:outer dense fiber protein 3-like isoform X1 [Cimex lectularius]